MERCISLQDFNDRIRYLIRLGQMPLNSHVFWWWYHSGTRPVFARFPFSHYEFPASPWTLIISKFVRARGVNLFLTLRSDTVVPAPILFQRINDFLHLQTKFSVVHSRFKGSRPG